MTRTFKLFLVAITLLLFLAGCGEPAVLPDLTGMDRDQIEEELTSRGYEVKFYFDLSEPYTDDDVYDTFVQYGSEMEAGDEIEPGTEVKVYTTPLELDPHYHEEMPDELQLEASDFQGKTFIADGIGEVTLERNVDGDTTRFRTEGQIITVRYLGIDTPESTALYQPWGNAASDFVKQRLENAESIVLEAEGERMDGNDRYLAWVWYVPDGATEYVLLNLELVEYAYSKDKVNIDSKYYDIIFDAAWEVSQTKRRVWGELDPAYDYSKEGIQMTIEYLLDNFDEYVGRKVVISGTITRKQGLHPYIQDETGHGIYLFAGYDAVAQIQVGVDLTIEGLTPAYYSGSPQLSNFKVSNLTVKSFDYDVDPIVITYDDFTFERIGTLVTMEHLEVMSIDESTTSSDIDINVKDLDGNRFVVRIDNSKWDVEELNINAGDVITVTGPLGYYDYDFEQAEGYVYQKANFQLMLTSLDDIVIEE